MKWHKQLYVSENVHGKRMKIIWKVNHGAGMVGVYLITLSSNPENLIDIIPSSMLLQPYIRKSCPMIIGITRGYVEAVDLTVSIIEEVYKNTGAFKVKDYIMDREASKGHQKRADAASDDSTSYAASDTDSHKQSAGALNKDLDRDSKINKGLDI